MHPLKAFSVVCTFSDGRVERRRMKSTSRKALQNCKALYQHLELESIE